MDCKPGKSLWLWMPVFAGLTIFMAVSIAFATPPAEVILNYDKDTQTLHVAAKHPSDRLTRHYLRRMVIYDNDVPVNTLDFTRQQYAWGLEEDVPLVVKGGHKVRVELFCSKGGIGEGETEVPPDDEE